MMNSTRRRIVLANLAVILAADLMTGAFAVTHTWDGGGDGHSWNDPQNWDTNTFPNQTGDTLNITLPTAASVVDNVRRDISGNTYSGGSTWRGVVNLNRGTVNLNAFFGTGSNGIFNIGDGVLTAGLPDAKVIASNSGWQFDRHSDGNYVINVKQDGELVGGNFQTFAGSTSRRWTLNVEGGSVTTPNSWIISNNLLSNSNRVNISNNGTVNVGAVTITGEKVNFTDVSGSFTASYGGSFANHASVEASLGVTFTSSGGGVTQVTDNGGSFTVFATTTPEVGGDATIGTMTLQGKAQNGVGGARFIRVLEQAGTSGNFHISEIEVFAAGVVPNQNVQNSVNGPALSSNDIVPAGFYAPGTTASLQHGNVLSVFDGDHESGGAVWSTNNVATPEYTLDLGVGASLGIIRVYPRNDTCCTDRFANVRVEVYGDDGTGNPGTLFDSFNGPTNAPTGSNAAVVGTVTTPALISADLLATLADDSTYIFEIDGALNDRIVISNPDPTVYNTLLNINNATIQVELLSSFIPGQVYKLFDVDSIIGTYDNLILPTGIDGRMLLVDGTVRAVAVTVPEPSTVALAVITFLSGSMVRRRRPAI